MAQQPTKGHAMASIALLRSFHGHGTGTDGAQRSPARALLDGVRHVFAAIQRAQQRYADREVARFLASRRGRFTDDIERQLMQRLTDRSFRP
jgi:hypothetical protein